VKEGRKEGRIVKEGRKDSEGRKEERIMKEGRIVKNEPSKKFVKPPHGLLA
jgi:hypothetical protein